MSGELSHPVTAELDRALAEAETLKYGDPARLLTVARNAARLAETLGDFRRYAQSLHHQALAHLNQQHYESSLSCALEVLVLARGQNFTEIEAWAVNTLGLNFFRCSIAYEAVRLYEYQLELGKQLGSGELQAAALHDWALIRMSEGDPEKQVTGMMSRAVALMPPTAHGGLDLSVIHANFAWCFIHAGQLDDAHAHLLLALELAQQAGSANVAGNVHVNLASLYMAREDLQAAREQLVLARACILSDVPDILSVNVELAETELLTQEGRHQEAMPGWERTYDLAIRAQMFEFAVRILNAAKDAYEALGDKDGVISAYKRLTGDIPRLQKQGNDLRFSVLRTVFALDKAALQSELNLSKQKNAILHRLSHEFRTPLTIIQSTADSVDQYGDRMTLEQRRERLQRITVQVKWMTLMLEDIVTLLEMDESAEISAAPHPFALADLAARTLDGLDHYRVSSMRVRLDLPPDAGIVTAPMQTLEKVAVHLLTNALKFSTDEVTFGLAAEGGALVMRVADQGIGIPPEELAAVFKPLVRGSNLDEVTGTGVGLAIVAKLVERIGGTIELSSVEGQGTTVTVRVPA